MSRFKYNFLITNGSGYAYALFFRWLGGYVIEEQVVSLYFERYWQVDLTQN